ncbi:Predicted dehydrogenase [Desulfomicrobium norvegicum]|uniref:Predicted dehydrogenase n=1 Tax=Desulfomicrobium norvegicum (strain DSM 1741 / NCIMB 8310) TaxID=52561 RepID=A0A8G2C594_DESNO|nr:Gfo/Idh/MocA family oxidoreductase [Desulfomicrobium norvegicum]SFM08246.1 Predicted dehydrogenase [Desulfomicrobium norvegicum]
MIRVGLIGFGYWGPNLARNVVSTPKMELKYIVDKDHSRISKASSLYPSVTTSNEPKIIFEDKNIDLVIIATPSSSHHLLTKNALHAEKHVLVEKPIALSSKDATELCELAELNKKLLIVDHTFLFTPSVRAMYTLVHNNDLGTIFYYDSVRVNLGLIQNDINVIWDLAPHDLSIVDYLFSPKRIQVSAFGSKHIGKTEDVAYITIKCDNNITAHFSLSWLSPVKIRRVLIGGDKAMLSWDDCQSDEKIKIYNRGIEPNSQDGIMTSMAGYRMGSMYSPHLPHTEALAIELEHITDCILNNKSPINDGRSSLRILKILEACDLSMKSMGTAIELNLNK